MEDTEALKDENAPEFTSVPGHPRGIDLAWSRDGRSAPGPGVGGTLLPFRADLLSRQFLARSSDGRRLLLEIPHDIYETASFPESWGTVDNRDVEEVWRNRTVVAAASDPPVPLGFDEYPPLFLCREKAVVFHPPWPGQGPAKPLEVCRDDELLGRAGLPGFDHSIERYLHNPAEMRTSSRLLLYTASPQRPASGAADVRSRGEFLRDMGWRVQGRTGGGPRRGPFPCMGCDQAEVCFPASGNRPGLAQQRIDVVALYPFRAIAAEVDLLSFGEHCDALGGATWGAFRRKHARSWELPGLALTRELLERSVFVDVAATTPIVAFAKKLALFESVVAAVGDYHRRLGQPHLGLTPDSVVSMTHPPQDTALPTVRLLSGLRTPTLRDDRSPPPGAPIWLPPPGLVAPYAAPDLVAGSSPAGLAGAMGRHQFAYGIPGPGRLTVGRVWDDPARGGVEFEAEFAAESLPTDPLHPTDLVLFEVTSAGWERTVLWFRADPERPPPPGRVTLRAYPVMLDSGQTRDLEAASRHGALFGSATIHRTYGAWYDLHALGLMLLRLLVDNSNQDLGDVVRDVLPALISISNAPAVRDSSQSFKRLAQGVSRAVRTAPLDRFLGDQNVCFFESETVEAGQRVPERPWAEALAMAVACVTTESSASYCRTTRIESPREAFCQPIDALLAAVRRVRSMVSAAAARAAPPAQPQDAIPVLSAEPLPEPQPVSYDSPGPAPSLDLPRSPSTREADLEREVRRLREALKAQQARVERLESERAALRAERQPEPAPAASPAAESAVEAWAELLAELTGTPDHGLSPPAPGDPVFELVRVIVGDGLETISSLLTAAAELGGDEFANEQRNVARLIRQALASGAPVDEAGALRYTAARAHFQRARRTLGGVIAGLVDAHERSTREGAQKMLVTLDVGLRRELKLNKSDERKMTELIDRMKGNLGELIARLYDPGFARYVKKHIQRGMDGGRRR